jgi:putative flippase GtrA
MERILNFSINCLQCLPYIRQFSVQTLRYALLGGSAVVVNWVFYFVSLHFIFQKQIWQINEYIAISAHIASLGLAFVLTFPLAFYLNWRYVFPQSHLPLRKQIFRYFLVNMFNLSASYALLKLMVEWWGWYPTISQMVVSVLLIGVSYLLQTYFTFAVRKSSKMVP